MFTLIFMYNLSTFSDELSDFKLYYGDLLKQLLYDSKGEAYDDGVFDVVLQMPLNISMLTVRLQNDTLNRSLTICEVEVYEGNLKH